MRIVILTEVGEKIGFGHLSRCNAIYEAFGSKSIFPEFILNADETIKDLLKEKKYRIFNWVKEQKRLLKLIKDVDILIMDSYQAGLNLYKRISETVKIPLYIDDNKRLDYPRGIVMNGSIYAEEINYPKKEGNSYLLGVKYAPLRKEFWKVPRRKINKNIDKIMITFGGNDVKNMTTKILKYLKKEYPNLKKRIIIGKGFSNIKEIEREKDKKTKLIYYPDAKKMKESMLESDIAISGGGQTLYELARVGVPTVVLAIADNQLNNIRGWQKVGFIEYVGWYNNKNLLSRLSKGIDMVSSYGEIIKRSKAGRNFINGRGAEAIVKALFN